METPDQYVHRAMKSDPSAAGDECGWKHDSTVSASRPRGCRPGPRRADASSTALPSPLNPLRGLLPSRPPGEAGGVSLMRDEDITPT
jgi:hypothetical protein